MLIEAELNSLYPSRQGIYLQCLEDVYCRRPKNHLVQYPVSNRFQLPVSREECMSIMMSHSLNIFQSLVTCDSGVEFYI